MPFPVPPPPQPRKGMPTAVVVLIWVLGGIMVGSIVVGVVIWKFVKPFSPIAKIEPAPVVDDGAKQRQQEELQRQQDLQQQQARQEEAARQQAQNEQDARDRQEAVRTAEATRQRLAQQKLEQQRLTPQRVPPPTRVDQRPLPPTQIQPPPPKQERAAVEPPRSVAPPPPPVAVAPPPPPRWTGPDSGQFEYSGPPVPQNGEVIFEPLPPGRVLLNYDQGKWSGTLEPLPNGTQRLVMRSLKAGNQKKLKVRWAH